MKTLIITFFLIGFWVAGAYAALDPPHSPNINYECNDCHYVDPNNPPSWYNGPDDPTTDNTMRNRLCLHCHDGATAAQMAAHSSYAMGDYSYGTWNVECVDCHNPHYQRQIRRYGSSAYNYTGTSTSILIDQPQAGQSQLVQTGAGWTTDQWQGMVLIPDTSAWWSMYRITGNTADTITVDGTINATAGSTFAIAYGKLIKDVVNSKTVRFLTNYDSQNSKSGFIQDDYTGICQVCHTQTNYWRTDGSEPTQNHNATSQSCTDCHSHPDGLKPTGGCTNCHGGSGTTGAPLVNADLVGVQDPTYPTTGHTEGAHNTHVETQGYTDCNICHNNHGMPTVDQKITIGYTGYATANGSTPVYDGTALSNGYTYQGDVTGPSTGTQDCSNVYCHSNVQGQTDGTGSPTAYGTPDWANASSVQCGTCHKADGTQGNATLMDSGTHTTHVNASTYNKPCSTCHTGAGSGTTNHANATIDVSIDATYGGSYDGNGAGDHSPGQGYGSCSNVYCHSDAQSTPTYASPAWGGSLPTDCTGCHGNNVSSSSAMASGSHTTHIDDSDNEVGRNLGCIDCHADTVSDDRTISNYANHVNKVKDIKVNIDGSTCSNIQCHSNGNFDGTVSYNNPTWGSTTLGCVDCHGDGATKAYPSYADGGAGTGDSNSHNAHVGTNSIACGQCHQETSTAGTSIDGTTPANHVNQVVEVSFSQGGTYNGTGESCSSTYCHGSATPQWGGTLADSTECDSCHGGNASSTATNGFGPMSTGKHTAHMNNSDPELGTFACGRCHADTVTTPDDRTITGTRHVDSNKDVYYDSLNPSATANTCNNVYCHSDGKGNYNNQVLSTVWYGATTLDCTGCHGDNGTSSFGEPDYANGGAGTAMANSHSAHVSVASDCGNCHTSTSTTGTDITGTLHINSNIDVTITSAYDNDADPANNFTPGVGNKTCSNVYCHSNGLGTYTTPQWGDTSTGCNFCHDALPTSGAHSNHVQTAATTYGDTSVDTTGGTYDFGCGNCHPVNAAEHRDGNLDITLNSTHGGPLKSLNNVSDDTSGYNQTPGSSVTCSAAYCHSKGNGTFVTSPDWYGTYTGDTCGHCHTNSPDTNAHGVHVVGIHYDNIYTGSTGLASAGTGNTNSHGNATYSTTINCNTCHNNTVTSSANDQNTVCATCHDGTQATLRGNASIAAGSTTHLNGTIDVAFENITVKSKAQLRDDITGITELNDNWTRTNGYKQAGSYDQANNALNTATMYDSATKTCSTVACHNGNSAKWTDTGISCTYCHTNLPK